MKIFHHLTICNFVKEYEGELREDQRALTLGVLPFDATKEHVKITENIAYRHDNSTPIHIMEIKLEKERHIQAFLEHIFTRLGKEAMEEIYHKHHPDDESYFYFRLDKEALIDGQFKLTTTGHCLHIRALIAAYPANAKNAKKLLETFLAPYARKAE